ncbi:sarcosine oxidase subunit gamma [Hydrogenophaga taeniospiralis]|uniref:sarcosine oxidase subunit gamma n=1 Tax=Hydrogenophaga taeniospiralis TaxID=65656 RepID=UPI001CFA34EC|nr:sarcosine oxidase subunit gamma family protein [Hydrogenophaga taeniospiralis]MCB4366965.1 sarcosine oxidase subunit gamma [Hydrogenophaga taeniospiralis]
MLDTSQRPVAPMDRVPTTRASTGQSLLAGWRHGQSVLNLRGNPDDTAFREGVSQALGLDLPTQACTTVANDTHRLVWVGPDDWFVIGPKGQAGAIEAALREALAGQHVAVTDVSGGYTVLHLSGTPVRDVLAQGCPLDLHPRVFGPGASAGSVFFKASVWLWQADDAPVYEVLVRSSFRGYVWLMLERCTQECGLVTRRFT